MFHCPVGVWVIEQHAIMVSVTVRSLTVTEICLKGQINNIPAFGSVNGLAPTRRQATLWINEGEFTDAYMPHPASMSSANIVSRASFAFNS